MQVNQKFIQRILSVNAKGEAVNATLIDLGQMAVKKAFSDGDKGYAQALMDTLIPVYRMPMKSWLSRYGVDVSALDKEHKGQFIVNGVRNQKDQKRIFDLFNAAKNGGTKLADVLLIVDRIPSPKKDVVLKGTPEERGNTRMTKVIDSLKEKDAAAAAYLQSKWAAKIADLTMCVYDASGNRFDVTPDEINAIVGQIVADRMAKKIERESSPLRKELIEQRKAA